MALYETVEEYTRKRGQYVEHVHICQMDADAYPSGWDYALHYGTIDGDTLLRYDNAHERSKKQERHEGDEVERIDFPGMNALRERFQPEVDDLPP